MFTDVSGLQTGGLITFDMNGLPRAQSGVPATLYVEGVPMMYFAGSCANGSGQAQVRLKIDGQHATTASRWINSDCDCPAVNLTFSIPNLANAVNADGRASFELDAVSNNNTGSKFCGSFRPTIRLEYASAGNGRMISVPIHFPNFGVRNWEKVRVSATGAAKVTLLDGDLQAIPDEFVPGNSNGLPNGSTYLWQLDADTYPTLHLAVELDNADRLQGWELFANDGFRWDFGGFGGLEGWQGLDDGAMPTVRVVDGEVLSLQSPVEGTNPRYELLFPEGQSVAADRFTELVVRLRTSNNDHDDEVALFWQNNFGLFDPVRSVRATDFLFDFQEVRFDLTQTPPPPGQPWIGNISGLRIDPVIDFIDELEQPVPGWAELDWVWLR